MVSTYSSLLGVAIGGKYEIRRVIGAGGMGVVCEALHVDLGKRVAIKLIDKTMKESELIVARFRREARAAGRIDSDHIVDVFDVGADNRVGLYMVMEHLTGEDLQSRLERETRIDTKVGVMIMHQIALALARAHAAGVIHRDLKPANVFLTERDGGQLLVKLLDFGVSKLIGDASGSARITGVGTPIGTPLYMAPEQAEGKDDVDGRADIWSLGAMMYESFAGLLPFADRGTYQSTLMGILTSRPSPLHSVAPWVPKPLAAVIDAMLVHDREGRIPDARTVTRRLVEAFPQVLPDGTGKRTAVILSQDRGAIDATGDTEFFSASGMPPSVRAGEAPRARESAETLADASAAETGEAAPLELPAPTPREAKKTEPLALAVRRAHATQPSFVGPSPVALPSAPPSAASVAPGAYAPPSAPPPAPLPSTPAPRETPAPETPAALEPLRARSAADLGQRKHPLATASVLLVIVLVGAGAYFAGRRASPAAAPPPPAPPATTTAAAATTASELRAPTPAPSAEPPRVEPAPPPPIPSADVAKLPEPAPTGSAAPPRPAAKRRRRPATTPGGTASAAVDTDAPSSSATVTPPTPMPGPFEQ